VVFITRRFWPLVGGAETMVANLSAALVARGARATIVTARWQSNWPATFSHCGVPVARLLHPPLRIWGTLRYMRELAAWLRGHRGEFDLAYVSQLKHDAYVAVRTGRRMGFPVVLRASGGGERGDCHWHTTGRCGMRIRREVHRAAAVVAPSAAIRDELLAAGFSSSIVKLIPSGVRIGVRASPIRRRQARSTIGTANAAMSLGPDTRLAVYLGRLHPGKGLANLISAWAQVAARQADTRLWLVGEGIEHAALVGQIDALGLSGRVVLPGAFDNVEDVLAAADLFVLPSESEGLSHALLEAMAAGLPVVASDIPGNAQAIRDGVEGLLVSPGDTTALAAAIEKMFAEPARAAEFGTVARRRVEEHFSLDRMVHSHLALFERLLGAGQP
jgi:glycosyltransferase involved in cell wall biosynthesis